MMSSKSNILILAAILLSFMVTTSVARPDSTLQSKSKCETEECLMKTTSDAQIDYIYTQKPPPTQALQGVEKKCETEECLMKTTSDAHLDYIYTQPSPPKPPGMEKKCDTEECLMKTTSDAHLDYIYTQTPPPKPATLNANP